MISSKPFFSNVEGIIRLVFEHRDTNLTLPITYEEDEINRLQNFWKEYLRNLRIENLNSLPESIADVIATVNNWLRSNTALIG